MWMNVIDRRTLRASAQSPCELLLNQVSGRYTASRTLADNVL